MAQLNNHLEVYKLLPRTNCRQCGLPTCLAFAVQVMQGSKSLDDCPYLEPEVIQGHGVKARERPSLAEDWQKRLAGLRSEVAAMDLGRAAQRLGGEFSGGKLSVGCLGKSFAIDQNGVVASQCHTNVWLSIPLLSYVASCQGRPIRQEWVPLRDLPGGKDWGRLFAQRCEKPLKQVVDNFTGLFAMLMDIFDAEAATAFDADIAVIIRPLPMLPVLICYWKPDDGLDSSLHMFFDATAEDNLNIEAIYILGVGLVTMFEKISQTHGQ